MPQEDKAKEPSVTFKAKAGLPSDPQDMEVHAAEGDLKPWDLESLPGFQHVGKPHPRFDGPLKVTGRAKFTYDVKLPGMLYGRMVGASVAAGIIQSIDPSKAEALPGVKAVWTAEAKKVRFAGQDVAAVAAVSPEIAEDAARLVEVTYDEKPFTPELRAAMEKDAPLVFAEGEAPVGEDQRQRGNVVGPRRGGRGNVRTGFAQAAATVEGTYYVPVHTHSCLETHGVVAQWEGDQLTVYASTQGVYSVREGLAEALEIDRKNVRVICEHMGGGFGSKLGPSATGTAFAVVACKLAKKAGAPVKLMLDRHQEHLCTGNAPSAQITVKMGAKKDGTLTAVDYVSHGSAGVAPGAGTAGPVNSLYANNPNLKVQEYAVFTNTGPGAKAIGWERRNKKAGDTPGPKKRGIGMANGNWYVFARGSGVGAQVKIHRDGSVELFSGAQDIGTGFRTAIAIVAAEGLGVAPEDITSRVGDTQFPEGPASGGSNTTNSVVPVVRLAANDARTKLFEVAAPALDADPAELKAEGGKVFVAADPSRSLTFKRLRGRAEEAVRDVPQGHRGHAVRGGRGRHRDRRGAGPQDGLRERLRLPDEHPDD
jgi:xanthine dehydrogenase YagR molybdenum-binding subunit